MSDEGLQCHLSSHDSLHQLRHLRPRLLRKIKNNETVSRIKGFVVANWPDVRPHNSKGAEYKSEQPDKSVTEIGRDSFTRNGRKGAEFLNCFVAFPFPLCVIETGVSTDFDKETEFFSSAAEYFGYSG